MNKPIENYQQMQIAFGNGLATGKFAMGSNQPLGSPSDWSESSLKYDESPKGFGDEYKHQDVGGKAGGSGNHQDPGANAGRSGSGVGKKRKRTMLTEEDTTVLSGMTAAINNVAEAIRETMVEDVHPDLYAAVMFVSGFTDEALIVAYSHLADNKALGSAYVQMSDSHRVLWLRTFLAKHYYN